MHGHLPLAVSSSEGQTSADKTAALVLAWSSLCSESLCIRPPLFSGKKLQNVYIDDSRKQFSLT